jgi:hypothetical protein
MRFNMGTQTKVIAIITTGMTRAMRLSDINLSPYDSQQERRLEGRNSLRGKQNSLRRTTSAEAEHWGGSMSLELSSTCSARKPTAVAE